MDFHRLTDDGVAVVRGFRWRMTATAMAVLLLLSGCISLPKGVLDNVLLVTLTDEAPRAFVASTYGPLSIGTELRASDAQTLAELMRLKRQAVPAPAGPGLKP